MYVRQRQIRNLTMLLLGQANCKTTRQQITKLKGARNKLDFSKLKSINTRTNKDKKRFIIYKRREEEEESAGAKVFLKRTVYWG